MRKVRNERLTAARLALAAGINTQQAVAEAISDLVHAATGKHPPIDADYISKLERGEITWPGADYRTAFRRHFGVSTDADLGFYSRRTSPAHPPTPSSELAVDDGSLTHDLDGATPTAAARCFPVVNRPHPAYLSLSNLVIEIVGRFDEDRSVDERPDPGLLPIEVSDVVVAALEVTS